MRTQANSNKAATAENTADTTVQLVRPGAKTVIAPSIAVDIVNIKLAIELALPIQAKRRAKLVSRMLVLCLISISLLSIIPLHFVEFHYYTAPVLNCSDGIVSLETQPLRD